MNLLQQGLAWIEPAIVTYGVWALLIVLYFESFGVPLPVARISAAISRSATSFWQPGSVLYWVTAPVI